MMMMRKILLLIILIIISIIIRLLFGKERVSELVKLRWLSRRKRQLGSPDVPIKGQLDSIHSIISKSSVNGNRSIRASYGTGIRHIRKNLILSRKDALVYLLIQRQHHQHQQQRQNSYHPSYVTNQVNQQAHNLTSININHHFHMRWTQIFSQFIPNLIDQFNNQALPFPP